MGMVRKALFAAICAAAFSGFAQNPAGTDELVAQLKKDLKLGSPGYFEERTDTGKNGIIKVLSNQDKDSKFEGSMRLTLELKAQDDTLWYAQTITKQGKRNVEYSGEDNWTFTFPIAHIKYPSVAYCLEYGFETNGVFTAVVEESKRCENAAELAERNKGNKNLLKVKGRGRALRENVD